VKGPWVRQSDSAIKNDHAQQEEFENVGETSAAARHAWEYISGRMLHKARLLYKDSEVRQS
jgi:hypothetical protein